LEKGPRNGLLPGNRGAKKRKKIKGEEKCLSKGGKVINNPGRKVKKKRNRPTAQEARKKEITANPRGEVRGKNWKKIGRGKGGAGKKKRGKEGKSRKEAPLQKRTEKNSPRGGRREEKRKKTGSYKKMGSRRREKDFNVHVFGGGQRRMQGRGETLLCKAVKGK